MPTYADVAPDVMEAFGTWFRDLRQQQQRKANRGHNNPVVFLRDASNSAIAEVVEPFSHLLRLEELQRGGIVAAEEQWRAFLARHGALPRGPAVTAARMQRRFILDATLYDSVCRCEAKQRDCLIAARDKWIKEIALRNEYELQCMQDYVQRALVARAAAGEMTQYLREEAQARALIVSVSDARLRCVHQAIEAAYAQLCGAARQNMGRRRANNAVLLELVDEEAQCRVALLAAAERHFHTIEGSATQQLERLAHSVLTIRITQQRAHEGVFSTIHDVESRCRQLLLDAEQSHYREFFVKERQQLDSLQLEVIQSMATRDGTLRRREEVLQATLDGEVVARALVVEAYIRWVTQIAAPELMLIGAHRAQELVAYERSANQLVSAFGRLVATERIERAAIEARCVEWHLHHFVPLERCQRADIPALLEQRMAQETLLRQPPSKHVQMWMDLAASESAVRSQIALGEKRWRMDIVIRLDQAIRGAPDVVQLLREVSDREWAQRTATEDSELRWRQFLMQSHEAERAKTIAKKALGSSRVNSTVAAASVVLPKKKAV